MFPRTCSQKWDHVDPLAPPRLFSFFATPESLCVLSSHPEGDRPENSVLQVVVVGVDVVMDEMDGHGMDGHGMDGHGDVGF